MGGIVPPIEYRRRKKRDEKSVPHILLYLIS